MTALFGWIVAGAERVTVRPETGATVTKRREWPVSSPSDAASCRTYSPNAEKLACVASAAGLVKVTGPGPETVVQANVSVEPKGKPSSLAVPASAAALG